MTEHPFMVMLLEQNSFLGVAETIEDEIMPLPEQLALEPGDVGILATANTQLENEFCVVKVVDPEPHAEAYPDWEERLLGLGRGGSHLLCEIFTRTDLDPYLGWVSRVKIMQITEEDYNVTLGWRESGFPDEIPDWTIDVYRDYADAMSERAPGTVPHSCTCPKCGSRKIDLVVDRKIEYRAQAGVFVRDGASRYLPVSDLEEKSSHVAQLRCLDCGDATTLAEEDWSFNR